MDWNLALDHNHQMLMRIVAHLFRWLKLEVGDSVQELPLYKKRTVYFVLRPSESACRRLVVVMAYLRGLVAPPVRERQTGAQRASAKTKTKTKAQSGDARRSKASPLFRLIDPRKAFDLNPDKPKRVPGPGPWITDMWSEDAYQDRSALYEYQERLKRAKEENLNAKALCNRLNALMAALEDLPGQAQRLVTMRARLERRRKRTGQPALAPMRPGRPPGCRQRHVHEVDHVLSECHKLARWVLSESAPPPEHC